MTKILSLDSHELIAIGRLSTDVLPLARSWATSRSLDGGKTWQTPRPLELTQDLYLNKAFPLRDGDGVLWMPGMAVDSTTRTQFLQILKSSDRGNTWQIDYQDQPPSGSQSNPVDFILTADGILYLSLQRSGSPTGSGHGELLKRKLSDPKGGGWVTLPNFPIPARYHAPSRLFSHQNELFSIDGTIDSASHYVLRKSTDGGASWTLLMNVLRDSEPLKPDHLFFDGSVLRGTTRPKPSASFYSAMDDAITFIESFDGGRSWKKHSVHIAYSPSGGNFEAHDLIEGSNNQPLLVGQSNHWSAQYHWSRTWNHLTLSSDRQSWRATDLNTPFSPLFNSAIFSALKAQSGELYMIGTSRGRDNFVQPHDLWTVRQSLDGGTTWNDIDFFALPEPFSFNTAARALTETTSGSILVFGHATQKAMESYALVRKSTDRGRSWSTVLMQRIPYHDPHQKIIACGRPSRILLTQRGYLDGTTARRNNLGEEWKVPAALQVSHDDGETWQELLVSLPGGETQWIQPLTSICLEDGSTLVLGRAQSNDVPNSESLLVLRSDAQGKNWTRLKPKESGFVPRTVVFYQDHFWIGGSKTNEKKEPRWTIIKATTDFQVMPHVDRDPGESDTVTSEVRKIILCPEGLCAAGVEFSRSNGMRSLFRVLKTAPSPKDL